MNKSSSNIELIKLIADMFKDSISAGVKSENFIGHNGPYFQKEPELRSLCHLGIIFLKLHNSGEDKIYRKCAKNIYSYLKSKIETERVLQFRDCKDADSGNGVIGAAWVLEFFWYYQKSMDISCEWVLEFIVHNYPFDADLRRFKRQKIDRNFGTHDNTFNHNLWLVSALSLFREENLTLQIQHLFLSELSSVSFYFDGVIYHKTSDGPPKTYRDYLRMLKWYPKSVSYQYFNLVALRRLANCSPIYEVQLECEKIIRRFKLRLWHIPILMFEKHGLRYNPSGWELIKCTTMLEKLVFRLSIKYFHKINAGEITRETDRHRHLTRVYELIELE